MTYFIVLTKPNRKKASVEQAGNQLIVSVDAPAHEGLANERLLEILAEYFHVAKSRIRIVRGKTAHIKHVEIT